LTVQVSPAWRAPPKVDQDCAREVAAMFLATSSRPDDPFVRAAYRQLEWESDAAFALLAGRQSVGEVRVAFTWEPTPYASDREMVEAVRAGHPLEVTTAARERYRRHPLLGCDLGGAYDRFRSVHDLVGHVGPGFGFDRDGELGAWLVQERLYTGLARWALATELHAEHCVRWTTGELSDHRATLLDRRLLVRVRHPTVGGDDSSSPRQRPGT
jgi:hypothetical protein